MGWALPRESFSGLSIGVFSDAAAAAAAAAAGAAGAGAVGPNFRSVLAPFGLPVSCRRYLFAVVNVGCRW